MSRPIARTEADPGTSYDPREAMVLHFFTNLALGQQADEALAPMGLGRIHHRILAVVDASPGMTVGNLLRVLRVTHQNVRLPLKQLIDKGYVLTRTDRADRRQRRLHVSASGRRLVATLQATQLDRISKAFEAAGPDAVRGFMQVHRYLVDADHLAFLEAMRRGAASEQVAGTE